MTFAKTITLAASAAAVTLATPAQAQAQDDQQAGSQVGTRFLRAPESVDAGQGRWMQKRVGNCVFNRHKDEARLLLANSDFYTIDYDAAGLDPDTLFDEMEVGYCMGRLMRGANNRTYQLNMQIQFSTLRNLLAEEAYLRDYDAPPAIAPGSPVEVAGRFDGERVHPQVATMAALADCLTYNAPQQSHDLLNARPGSGDEEEIVEALGPVVVACADTDETEMTIPASLIRQMAADGLWSRSYYGSAS